MATPAQLAVEAAGDNYLRLKFVQGEVTMTTSEGHGVAEVILQYPRQGQMMRHEGEPSQIEHRATELNAALEHFNSLLAKWCS